MEASAEVSGSMETSVGAPRLKTKGNDEQLPQQSDTLDTPGNTAHQSDTLNALENAAQVTIPRSRDTFMESLAGRGISFDQGSASDPGMAVEELTLSNYKCPTFLRGEESSVKKGLWNNFTRLGSEQRGGNATLRYPSSVGDREDARSSFIPRVSMRMHSGSTQFEPSYSKVADHLVESDKRIASKSLLNKPMTGTRTKVLPASGFSQFLVNKSSRGKGAAYRNLGVHMEPCGEPRSPSNVVRHTNDTEVDNNLRDRQTLDANHDELSLREWLAPRRHKLDKLERLHMFKQILKIVDTAHSQGLVLQHLQPSYFLISLSNHVKYAGSFFPKSQMEQLADTNKGLDSYAERPSKTRKYWQHDNESSPEYQKLDESYQNCMIPGTVAVTSGCQRSTLESSKLERKWYDSPEELNNSACAFYSNIYSLGVLFFELFCYFQYWDVHSAAMSDLRHRILPSTFLSDSPKEAGFCLWLLHPEPSSRPSSRDILLSDLPSEGHDLSFPGLSLASIDEEDVEAGLLLHFLLNMKGEKEKQAAKLVANVGCLTTYIEEVEKRYSSRTESLSYASGLPVPNEISYNHSIKEPVHLEVTSALSMSSMSSGNGERLIRNLDKLENAYFSMRSKIDVSQSNTASRSDTDVLRIRDRSSQVQNDTHVGRDSTDSLGSFFEGLYKYARYSKFELCGSLRSVDIINPANVICSLSFDRDEDYFAAAGVSKKIKFFEFGALLNDTVDIHYPLIEMSSRTKLSCVCWNSYIKNYLASTDHEGVVQVSISV